MAGGEVSLVGPTKRFGDVVAVDSATLRFRDAAGATAFVAFFRPHAAA